MNYIQNILSYFTSMDIAKLRLHLKDECNYQETTKEIFLNRIEEIFDAYKNSGDTELIIYKGACAGKKCVNCGNKGFRFVGNNSGNYMDLLFEIEGDDIKDIYYCAKFKTEIKIKKRGEKSHIYFNKDDQVTFNKTPDYWAKVYSASAAFSEIISSPPRRIDFSELSYWVKKHSVTDETIGSYSIFKSKMRWTQFSELYADLKRTEHYISLYLNDIKYSISKISILNTEEELIDWILENEILYEAASYDLSCNFIKDGEHYTLSRKNIIIFHGEQFDITYKFLNFYSENHQKLLDKYNSFTIDEEVEIINKQDNVSNEITSLRFHIENRKVMEELGISIPFYNKSENMPF